MASGVRKSVWRLLRPERATRARVIADCEYALKTLSVERIDLFQLHWPTPQPVVETATACAELIQAGKIRAVGVSNFSLAQLEESIEAGAKLILLDNFTPDRMAEAVRLTAGRAELEASGGINLDNIRAYAQTGVDRISIGTLTKDIKAVDLSMRFQAD